MALSPQTGRNPGSRSAALMREKVSPQRPNVSVVIPTCNRPDLLQRCLEAVLAQADVEGNVEVVIVDDARSAQQEALLAGYIGRPGRVAVRYLRQSGTKHGPAAARNTGWRAAYAPIIAFTDDDTVPDRHWLRHGLAAMQDSCDAAWGRVVVPMPSRPTDFERNIGGLHEAEFVTANCFIRRQTLVEIDGFDERFEHPWREDSDLYFTLLERGYAVRAAPAAIVEHPVRRAPPGTSIRQHRNLLFEALLYKKHRRLYRQKIASAPPWRYYAAVIALAASGLALLAGQPAAATACASLWLLVTAWIAMRRLWGTARSLTNLSDIVLTSFLIPIVAVFWRLAGALRYRVPFA